MSKWYEELWQDDCGFRIKSELIHSQNSDFQKIDFYNSKTFGTFFTLDDLMMVNQKDEFIYHDMICHPAFAVNPNIKNVLIIGGGDGGSAREVLRYSSVEKVVMVEIDELVFRLCQKYLPQTANIEHDQRLELIFNNGLEYVKNCNNAKFDLILVDSTDPISIGEGLFTNEFYNNCHRVLSDSGILINQHESPYFSNYADEMRKAHQKISDKFKYAYVYQFHMPTYPSGHWLFGFASKSLHPLDDLNDNWLDFGLDTKYYNMNLHRGAFCLPTYVLRGLKNE